MRSLATSKQITSTHRAVAEVEARLAVEACGRRMATVLDGINSQFECGRVDDCMHEKSFGLASKVAVKVLQ